MVILFPKNIDRVRSPMSALFLGIIRGNPDLEFASFSSPQSDEDRRQSDAIWALPNLRRITPLDLVHQRFDVVQHASAGQANYRVCRLLRRWGRGRPVHLFTANCQPYPTHPRRELLLRCARSADCLVSVSRSVADDLQAECGRPSDAIIPNGFDPEVYTLSTTRGEKPPFLLYASNWLDRKRPDWIVALARAAPELQFVMAGGRPVDADLIALAEEAEALPNLSVLGSIDREALRDLMQEASVLLHPSEFEGLPLSVVEAMATGLPVIAQPKSSLPEIITPGANGWLLATDSADEWLARIRSVLAWTQDERAARGRAIRESVLSRFSWSVVAQQYGDLYRQCVQPEGLPHG